MTITAGILGIFKQGYIYINDDILRDTKIMKKIKNLVLSTVTLAILGSTPAALFAAPLKVTPAKSGAGYGYVPDHTTLIHQIRRSGVNVSMPKLEYDPNVIFDPNGARSMKVMGVLQNPNQVQVMLKTRNSSVVQIVAVGSALNHGQTVVKKVDRINTTEPIVTFEEDGIEVRRRVGEN
jgi:hypothetical protein